MNAVLDFLRAALPWITIGLLYAVLFTIRAELKNREKQVADCGAEGMSLGIVLGVGFEICFANNSGMGLALGMLIGLAIGTCIRRENRGEADDEA